MEVSPIAPDASSFTRPVEATSECSPVVQIAETKDDEKSVDATASETSGSSEPTTDNQQQDGNCNTDFTTMKAQDCPEPSPISVPTTSLTERLQENVDTITLNTNKLSSQQDTNDVAEVDALLSGESTIDQLLTSAPLSESTSATPEEPTIQPHPKSDKSKKEKKSNESFATEETLTVVQQFLIDKITLNQCSSHSKEFLEFVGQHLSEKQRRRYVGPMIQRIVAHFGEVAKTEGGDVSVDVQSSICIVEQMLLALGRESPLQDMYTQEEEEMLDLLFHGEPDAGELAIPN